ncbi:MAG: MFS transporter [Solirubrobacterales bacterium]
MSLESSSGTGPSRGRFGHGPFAYPPFRRLMAARFISTMGSWMQTVAAGYLVFQISGNAMYVGLLAAVALGPSLAGASIGGRLADRYCPRKLSIAFCLIEVFPPLALAVLAFSDALTIPAIFGCVLALSIPHSMSQPIFALVIPYSVPEELRHEAVADTSAVYNVGQLVGAVLGGMAIQDIGAGLAFSINALSYLVVAIVLITSPILQRACDLARAHHDVSIRTGFREGWGLLVVKMAIVGAATFFLLVAPIEQLMPKIAAEHGEGAMLLGLMIGSLTVGAILANPFVRRWTRDTRSSEKTLVAGVLVSSPTVLALGFSSSLATDIPLLVVLGFTWEMIFVSGGSALQLDVPVAIKGRMVGIFYTLVTGAAALGAILMGALFQDLGVSTSLIIVGVCAGLSGLALYFRWRSGLGVLQPPS